MGTAHYIAPEQALGHEAEPASDVYSLAVVGYECLTGRRPFLSENAVTVAMMHIRDMPPPLPPDVPPGARAIIEATLSKDPRQRYGNGGEFAAAVAAVRAGRPLPAPSGLAMAGAQQQHGGLHTGTHPRMMPVPPPGHATPGSGSFGMGMPQPPQRHGRTGLWITIAILAVALIAALAFGLPAIMRSSGDSPNDNAPRGTNEMTEPSDSQEPGGRPGSESTSKPARPTTQTSSEDDDTVTIIPTRYAKRPADQVQRELADLGLDVVVVTESGATAPDESNCLVADISPLGQVNRDSIVTIVCRPSVGPPG